MKDGLDWMAGCLNNLNPTNAKNAPASNVYVVVVQKFSKCNVGTGMGMGPIKYDVHVSRVLQETIESLRASTTFSRNLKDNAKIFLYSASTMLVIVY